MEIALLGFSSGYSGRTVEPAGISYEVNYIRDQLLLGDWNSINSVPRSALKKVWSSLNFATKRRDQNDSEDERISGTDEEDSDSPSSAEDMDYEENIADWMDPDDDSFLKFMQGLDPRCWKDQDHYRVLGLSNLRYRAVKEQIRIAYRKKVLNHHPDKRKHRGLSVKQGDDDYFACITKAYETLGSVHRRRAFDSVDPDFDASVPSASDLVAGGFFEVLVPVFQRNARWSRKKPVPCLGDEDTEFSKVDEFYRFWFEFPSWREFSYLDEEDKEKGECREERRWMEKQNKAAREKRRREETKRIRGLVELAYANDPRIQRHKEEEKRKREAEKLARKEAQRLKKELEDKERREAEERERRRTEEEEMRRKLERENQKKEREAKKKAVQRERKHLAERCKELDYFATTAEDRLKNMEDVDRLCKLLECHKLQQLNFALREHNGSSVEEVFRKTVDELDTMLEEERMKAVADSDLWKKGTGREKGSKQAKWTEEEVQLLVKAATLFPVGTKSRWEVVAEFINEHRKEEAGAKQKTAKDVIAKAKELQSSDASGKESVGVGKVGLVRKKEGSSDHLPPPTERTECPAEMLGEAVWSAEEQKLLEQALRTYPGSTPDRWDRIADCIPGKTKKDCVRRFKELAELVRAKKAAQEKVAASGK